MRVSDPNRIEHTPEQGEIFLVDLPKQDIRINGKRIRGRGREIFGLHRCLVLQVARATERLPYTIIVPISSVREKSERHSWVKVLGGTIPKLPNDSYILCEQIRSVDKQRIEEYVGKLSNPLFVLVQKVLENLCPPFLDSIT